MKNHNIAKHLMLASAVLLVSCGNPVGISDSEYAKYKELGAPKILYSCSAPKSFIEIAAAECPNISQPPTEGDLACIKKSAERHSDPNEKIPSYGYIAGVGIGATYNHILEEAKNKCNGEFKVIESVQ